MVLQFDPFIHRHIVLDPAAVPDLDVVADVDVLSKGAVFTDYGALLDMAEMPDLGAGAD